MPVRPAGGSGTLLSKLVNSLNVNGIDMICVTHYAQASKQRRARHARHPYAHARHAKHTSTPCMHAPHARTALRVRARLLVLCCVCRVRETVLCCVGEAVGLCGRGGGVLWKRRSGCVGEAVGCCVRQVARPRASLPPTSSRTWLHPLLYTDQTLESSRAQLSRDSSTKPHPATAQPHLTQSSPTAQHSAQARLGKSGIAGMSKPQAYRHKSLDHVRDHRHQNLTDT